MSKKKKTPKRLPLVNFKAEPAVKRKLAVQAKKHGMTLSEWVRFAGMTFQPTKAQLTRRLAA